MELFYNLVVKLIKNKIMKKNDAPGMKGERSRNQNGELRQKRSDTHVGTIEKQYNIDLGVRSDKHLGTVLKQSGLDSLSDLIKKK
jgi:hypothetical protein